MLLTDMCKSFFRSLFLLGVAVELEGDLPIIAADVSPAIAECYARVWRVLDIVEGASLTDEELDQAAELARLRAEVLS